jgi:hypothetical protein
MNGKHYKSVFIQTVKQTKPQNNKYVVNQTVKHFGYFYFLICSFSFEKKT